MRALALLVLLLTPAGAWAEGAIAFDRYTGRYGAAWNLPPDAAEARALRACNAPGCQVVARVPRGSCGALASTPNGRGFGSAVRPTREAARAAAQGGCQTYAFGECMARVTDCSR